MKFDNNSNKINKIFEVELSTKSIKLNQIGCLNSTFFLFAQTSFKKKLADLKDFVYFVTTVIKLNLA